jgi:hypothetical protein
MRAVKAKRLRREQTRLQAAGLKVPRNLDVFARWLDRYRIGRR